MNKSIFLTSDGRELGHWMRAFPDAHCAGATGLQSRWFSPGVVVWSCGIRLSVLTQLLKKYPAVHLVFMSMKPSAEEGLRAVEAGAKGYCHALAAASMLKEVELVVTHGGLWLGPELMQRAVKAVAHLPQLQESKQNPWHCLTQRENAVAQCITQGAANREIADKLGITPRTVKAHLASMFEKLAVRDRLQLALILGSQEPDEHESEAFSGPDDSDPVPKDNRQSA